MTLCTYNKVLVNQISCLDMDGKSTKTKRFVIDSQVNFKVTRGVLPLRKIMCHWFVGRQMVEEDNLKFITFCRGNVGREVQLTCHVELSFKRCTDLWLLFPGGSVKIEPLLRQNKCRSASIFTDVQRFSLLIFRHYFGSSKEPMYCIIRVFQLFHRKFFADSNSVTSNLSSLKILEQKYLSTHSNVVTGECSVLVIHENL